MDYLLQIASAAALLAVYYLHIGLYYLLRFWPVTLFFVLLIVVAVFANRKNQPRSLS